MKTDILATIDAVLAENRDVKRQRMFAKVMDLLDNPTQCAVPTAHLVDTSVFHELPGEAERVDHYAATSWKACEWYALEPEPDSTTCLITDCGVGRAPERLFCQSCVTAYEWVDDANFRPDAVWFK